MASSTDPKSPGGLGFRDGVHEEAARFFGARARTIGSSNTPTSRRGGLSESLPSNPGLSLEKRSLQTVFPGAVHTAAASSSALRRAVKTTYGNTKSHGGREATKGAARPTCRPTHLAQSVCWVRAASASQVVMRASTHMLADTPTRWRSFREASKHTLTERFAASLRACILWAVSRACL